MTGLNGHISCLPEAAQCIVGVYGRWGGGIQRGKQRLVYAMNRAADSQQSVIFLKS